MKITLPPKVENLQDDGSLSPLDLEELEFNHLVIVGANGSGKTRFSVEIEKNYSHSTHRISAQKSLKFNSSVTTRNIEVAQKELFFGTYSPKWTYQTLLRNKESSRWGGSYHNHLLDDYDRLLILLHTEEFEQSLAFKEGRIEKPETKLDIVQKIWEKLLPHRKLFKKAGNIKVYSPEFPEFQYDAIELSDGERVIFYLIAQAICVPKDCMIIIDEPEMHIHKSLVIKLFDLIEKERQDCSFIYLTHDIDFAVSRQNAQKIWMQSYEGNIWNYQILENTSPIPEAVYLEILGSRKPILFVEGDPGSLDYRLYEQVYPEYTVKSLGSCQKVIQSVKAFNEEKEFHNLEAFGIIDRDRRSEEDILRLNKKNIWVLDVAEIENVFLIEEIVKVLASHMMIEDIDKTWETVKKNIVDFFKEEIDHQIVIHFEEALRSQLIGASRLKHKKNKEELFNSIKSDISAIQIESFYNEIETKFKKLVAQADYESILKVFNLKNAIIPKSKICQSIKIKDQESYIDLIWKKIKVQDEDSQKLIEAIDQTVLKCIVLV